MRRTDSQRRSAASLGSCVLANSCCASTIWSDNSIGVRRPSTQKATTLLRASDFILLGTKKPCLVSWVVNREKPQSKETSTRWSLNCRGSLRLFEADRIGQLQISVCVRVESAVPLATPLDRAGRSMCAVILSSAENHASTQRV
jgi:hypothetical protein